MSTGRIIQNDGGTKARAPQQVYVSDGQMKYPIGHPLYYTQLQPDGLLLLNLYNNEYSEFRLDTDRDCNLILYNHMNGSRYKLFIYRKTTDAINISFVTEGFIYVVPGIEEGQTEKVLILNIEVTQLNGQLINKVGPTSESIDAVIASLNTSSIKISEDIQFNGVSQGSYKDGDIIKKGSLLTNVLRNFAQKANPVSYSAPSFGITPNNTAVEAGTMVNPTIIPSFTQRDAGALNRYLLQLSTGGAANVTLLDVATLQNYNQASVQVQDGAYLKYTATGYYNEGLTKLNNMGEEVPVGKILAGDKSDTLTYSGLRNVFYGTGTVNSNPASSDEIRALSSKKLNPINGTTFTINIATGTKRIVIAYPATLRDISTIKYVEVGNAEVADTFQKINLQVEGANGFMAIDYKVFVYIPAVPFGSNATYKVTI